MNTQDGNGKGSGKGSGAKPPKPPKRPKSPPKDYSDAPYPVGKGKTPVHTRFKPGQSGRPAGRPRKKALPAVEPTQLTKKDRNDVFLRVMNEEVEVTKDGRSESVFFEGPVGLLTAAAVLRECKLTRGQLDCLIGGPPCQSFSYNNHQRTEKDARAKLFEEYLRLVDGLWPKTLVMENVPGILTIGDGSVVSTIRSSLETLGYKAEGISQQELMKKLKSSNTLLAPTSASSLAGTGRGRR